MVVICILVSTFSEVQREYLGFSFINLVPPIIDHTAQVIGSA